MSCVNNCGNWIHVACGGNINARAVVVPRTTRSCTDVINSTSGLGGTVIGFTPGSASQPTPQTQSGGNYVSFNNIVGGTYTVNPTTPANYNILLACWRTQLNSPTSGSGLTSHLSEPNNNDTLTWDLGYTAGSPWVQTQGGGVYAAGNLTSYLPVGISPRVFNLSGSGGYPGLVAYGGSFDFDASPNSQGATLVSATNWLTNQTHAGHDWYAYFANKFDLPNSIPTGGSIYTGAGALPASSGVYYVNGDLTTSGNWLVPAGQQITIFVTGNLTIGGNINLTSGGYLALIVQGNITVDPGVGVPYTSTSPVVEGVYVADGTFATGATTAPATARLVARGMFITGGFNLERDLDLVGANMTTSSELFTYNPQLLFLMPEAMKDLPVSWQEVPP